MSDPIEDALGPGGDITPRLDAIEGELRKILMRLTGRLDELEVRVEQLERALAEIE